MVLIVGDCGKIDKVIVIGGGGFTFEHFIHESGESDLIDEVMLLLFGGIVLFF